MSENELSKRLEQVRGRLTQKEFAEQLDTPVSSVGNYERGYRTPSIEYLAAIYKKFGYRLEWLVLGEKPEKAGENNVVNEPPEKYKPKLVSIDQLALQQNQILKSVTREANSLGLGDSQKHRLSMAVLFYDQELPADQPNSAPFFANPAVNGA